MSFIVTFSPTLESHLYEMTDAELVQQILNGNSNAFKFLVSKNQRLVVHIVGRIVRQQEDLEDICQEVFVKVFQKIRKFRGDSQLSTWIATIAYNTSISHLRKQNRKLEVSFDESPGLIAGEEEAGFPAGAFEMEEAKTYLLKLIEQLPVHYRTVLTLFHLEEFSYREIEEITGMPEGTIKSYLSRARKLLKDKIELVFESEKTNIFADYVER
jgi:RNA polymerase sigma factor (sigma-70 family)